MPIPLQRGVNKFGGVNWHRRPHRPVATILPQARPQGEMGGHSATGFGVTTGAGCQVVQAPKPDGALACEPRFSLPSRRSTWADSLPTAGDTKHSSFLNDAVANALTAFLPTSAAFLPDRPCGRSASSEIAPACPSEAERARMAVRSQTQPIKQTSDQSGLSPTADSLQRQVRRDHVCADDHYSLP